MSAPDIRTAGPRALLLELDDLDAVLALHGRLAADPLPGQAEVLAAARTVLVSFESPADARNARAALLGPAAAASRARRSGRTVEIGVAYDGEDLAEVARLTGLSPEAVVAAHSGTPWTAAFGGFAPGFMYLTGGDPRLQVPRRPSPRTSVPAGSVALAGEYSAVYPRSSPGGWQLIGRTGERLWDLGRDRPALLAPGDTVRFVPVRESATAAPGGGAAAGNAAASGDAGDGGTARHGSAAAAGDGGAAGALEVASAGLQCLVQDLGRRGLGDLGVAASGAADASAARQANRLVGNGPGAAVLECLVGGQRLRARGDQVLAVTGARTALRVVPAAADAAESDGGAPPPAGRRPAQDAPFVLLDGETLELEPASAGLRAYVAVRGGIGAEPVLGSRATDSLSGLGPAALAAGDAVPVLAAPPNQVVGNPEPPVRLPVPGEPAVLRAVPGPRDDWFGPGGLARLASTEWRVSSESNRIGVRLEAGPGGEPLARVRDGELASEGVALGSLQVPPSGLPVLFLADHPVTGGYPVIAVVVPEDVALAAQLPPGTPIRFELAGPDADPRRAAATQTPTPEGTPA